MTSFYDRYNLTRNPSISENSTILKQDFTLSYTDYEKLKIGEQYNKLYANIYETNKNNIQINENLKIYNLSLYELVARSGKVYITLLNDLSIFFSKDNKDKNINKLGLIITKDENLLYIGLLILSLSFLLWLIQITL